jgi:hypothetical protein
MIEERLKIIHKAIARAGFLMVHQIVMRKLTRSCLIEALEKIKFATKELEHLIANTNNMNILKKKLLDNKAIGENDGTSPNKN